MKHDTFDHFHKTLHSLMFHWQHSAHAYAEYMNSGKKFRYAELLKQHNSAARKLLADNMDTIPGQLKEEARRIIEHYDIWSAKWDDHQSKLNPGPDDEFVFENEHRFPRAAALELEAAYRELS